MGLSVDADGDVDAVFSDVYLIATTPISALRVVSYVTPTTVAYADPSAAIAVRCVAGVTRTAAAVGGSVTVCAGGWVIDSSWNWTIGNPIFCGLNGVPTQIWSAMWERVITVGYAINPTTMLVRFSEPIEQEV